MNKYEIKQKTRAFVRDGAANVVKACRFLEIPSFDCINHKLHLAASDGTDKVVGLKRVIENYKKIVRKLKKSTVCQNDLEMYQNLHDIPELTLTKNAEVRWGSIRNMFLRALTCKEAIKDLLVKHPDLPTLSESDWNLMQLTCDLLQPLSEISDKAQEHGCTASVIIPLSNFLIDLMSERTESPEASVSIATRMRCELGKYEKCDFLRFSTLLDNRYKNLFLDSNVKNQLIESVMKEKELESDLSLDEFRVLEPPEKKAKNNFEKFIESKKKDKTVVSIDLDYEMALKMELEKFLSMPCDERCPIEFWTNDITVSVYPLLSKYGQRFVICPPGSAEVERLFSTAGQILTKYRKSMSPEMFEKLLFLNKNLRLMN